MPFGMFAGLVAIIFCWKAIRRSMQYGDVRRCARHVVIALIIVAGGAYLDMDFWHALAERTGFTMASLPR